MHWVISQECILSQRVPENCHHYTCPLYNASLHTVTPGRRQPHASPR